MQCTDFGQSSAAVLGIKNSNPIVETSHGQLEIIDSSLSVGCSDCIQIINEETKEIEHKYYSPGWDLILTGHKNSNFSYDRNGHVYISSGGKCLKIPKSGLYMRAKGKCHSAIPYKDFKFKPAGKYYKSQSSKFVMLLRSGSCT